MIVKKNILYKTKIEVEHNFGKKESPCGAERHALPNGSSEM